MFPSCNLEKIMVPPPGGNHGAHRIVYRLSFGPQSSGSASARSESSGSQHSDRDFTISDSSDTQASDSASSRSDFSDTKDSTSASSTSDSTLSTQRVFHQPLLNQTLLMHRVQLKILLELFKQVGHHAFLLSALNHRFCFLLFSLHLGLGLLLSHLPGAPGHIPQVEERVDDEQQVHGWDSHVVDEAEGQAVELIGMEHGRHNEGQEDAEKAES